MTARRNVPCRRSPVEKDMLGVIQLEKLLAIERVTVENGTH
jgi:hypothetical protein